MRFWGREESFVEQVGNHDPELNCRFDKKEDFFGLTLVSFRTLSVAESLSQVVKQMHKTNKSLDELSRSSREVAEVSSQWRKSYRDNSTEDTSLDSSQSQSSKDDN